NRANSGGGIYNDNFGTLTATNDTISNNRANNSGGGIYNSNSGTLTATNDTISNNRANNSGGGIYNSGTLTLAADLLATKGGAPSRGECGGYVTKITDLGYIVADDNTCGFPSSPAANTSTSIVSTASENLGPLQNNGGPTQTILPEPGNPAIGLIPTNTRVTIVTGGPSITLCPTTDQRGISATGPYCNAGSV
ncbi:choice-of-anchor Q domain-containing protein, partial [Acidithrix ferrooxidans]|uniref:choice-of-anchor Q domain-containing protein n=1 Tax=Acidithrix ferrooxidans TaxID=1280514 RepID=UPI000A54B7FF